MADVSKTIEIIFAGVDNASGTIQDIGSEMQSMGSAMQDVGQPFADAAEKILLMEAALVAISVGGLTLAVVKAGEFKTGMAEVNTLLDVSEQEFAGLSAGLVTYSQESTASMGDLQESLYNMISLGVDYKDSLETLTTIEQLSVATKSTMNDATETLIGTMNAYGAPMSQAADYSDAFFTIIQDGKTTLPELSQSIAQVTGIAATAGIPFETLGATIAAITATGAPTSQAITQIKAAIQALIAPTEATAKAASDMGVDIGQAAVKSKGFEVVLKEIYDAANGDIEIMKTIIPSIEGLGAASVLGADSAGVLAKALEDMGNNTGATEEAFEKMKDNLGLVWQNMLNNWDAIWIKFGLTLGGSGADIIKASSDLFKSIAAGFDAGEFDEITDFINSFMGDIESLISNMAANMPNALSNVDFGALVASFEGVIDEITNLFSEMGIDLTTVKGLTEAIDFVVEAIGTLQDVTGGIVSAFTPLISASKDLAEIFIGLSPEVKKLVGEVIGFGAQLAIVGGIVATGGTLLAGIGALASALGSGGLIATGLTAIVGLITGPVGFVVALGAGAYALKEFASSNETLQGWAESTKGYFQEVAASSAENMGATAGSISTMGGQFQGVSQEAIDLLATFDVFPAEIETAHQLSRDQQAVDQAIFDMNQIPKEINTNVRAESDHLSMQTAAADLNAAAPPEKKSTVVLDVNKESALAMQKEIALITGENKILQIEIQGEIDKELADIEARADLVQAHFEWEAKVEVAEIEAQAQIISSAFDAAASSVEATAAAAADMYGSLVSNMGDLGFVDKEIMLSILGKQLAMEQEALSIQRDLTNAQIEYMQIRASALLSGDGLVKIDSSGLEPALEMILWEILEKIQIRATEQNAEMLLGINL